MITGYEWQALQTISKCSLESIDLIRAMHHRSNRLISVIRCWRNFKRSKGEAIAGTLSIRSTHSNRNCARSIGTGKGNHRAKNRDTYRARSFWIFDPPSRRIEIPSEYGTSTTIVSDDEWNTDEDYLYSAMLYVNERRESYYTYKHRFFPLFINRNIERKLYFISHNHFLISSYSSDPLYQTSFDNLTL